MIYFVGTPIGNLEDITLRALNVLKSVDIIACEDTRTSQKLLNKFQITKKLISFHKFNEAATCQKILNLDSEGKNIAIISDAGMPVISDPGNILTKTLKQKDIKFTVIPGANAALSALILSGFDASSFHFAGFLPEKNIEKTKLLQELSLIKSTIIFYISPHNLLKSLKSIFEVFGQRKCALVKEITKIYEKTYSFNLGDNIFVANNDEESKMASKEDVVIVGKGEFVLVVEGASKDKTFSETNVLDHVKFYINLGLSKNDAIKRVAFERGVKKDTIYKSVLTL